MFNVQQLLFFLVTLLLMGFFAGMEMAYYSASRINVELRKKQGIASSRILSEFFDAPVSFLGTTLIGYTIFLVFFTIQIDAVMHPLWQLIGWESLPTVQLIVEVILSTLIVLIFGQFIPRALFRAHANSLLNFFVYIISIFYRIFSPITNFLVDVSEWLSNIRVRDEQEAFGRKQLDLIFKQGPESDDEDEERNKELIENALELPKTRIRQCLVPRKEIVGIDKQSTMQELRLKFMETKMSKLIVYDGSIDNIEGYVHQLDLFKRPEQLETILHPIPAVPESMTATDLINKFSTERKSIAWVVDEFGGTAGIITMEDVLEEVFGEIRDEYDTEEFVEKQISENEYIFSGRLELDHLMEKYELHFPESESETLSGFIIGHHETIPVQKERIIIDNYEFDVLNVSDTRIEMVKLKVLK